MISIKLNIFFDYCESIISSAQPSVLFRSILTAPQPESNTANAAPQKQIYEMTSSFHRKTAPRIIGQHVSLVAFCFAPLLFSLASAAGADSLMFELKPLQTKCFKESVLPDVDIRGEVQILQGMKDMSVTFLIVSSQNSVLYSKEGVGHEKWSFKTPKKRKKKVK